MFNFNKNNINNNSKNNNTNSNSKSKYTNNNNDNNNNNNNLSTKSAIDLTLLQPLKCIRFDNILRNDYKALNSKRPLYPRLNNSPFYSKMNKSSDNIRSNDFDKSSLIYKKINKNNNNNIDLNASNITNINQNKTSDISIDNTIANIHDELYYYKKVISNKHKEKLNKYIQQVYPFKPTISKPKYIKSFTKKEDRNEFINRLLNSKKVSDDKYNHTKRIEENVYSFRPNIDKIIKEKSNSKSINKNKQYLRRDVDPNFNDFYGEKQIANKMKLEKEEIINKNINNSYLQKECFKKIAKIKILKAKEVFDKLDDDNDGLISIDNINLSSLDIRVLKSLSSVFEKIKDSKDNNIDFKKFFKMLYNNNDTNDDESMNISSF